MPSLPLDVHHVLEDEFVSMYGPLKRPESGVEYTAKQILDPAAVRDLLRECRIDVGAGADSIAVELNVLVNTNAAPKKIAASPAFSETGRVLLERYDELRALAEARDACRRETWGPRELRRTIVDHAFGAAVKPLRSVRLDNLYSQIHARAGDAEDPRPRTALCISGGGIRSATFALGILQGLATARLLRTFDYLSTVSGGGYIGSWLSSWARRHPGGIRGVETELHRSDTAIGEVDHKGERTSCGHPDSPIDPEPSPLRHLREYSNYLSPRLGLLSGDSWTIAALYLRNLLLNLLILVPLLACVLAIPRFFSWGLVKGHYIPPLSYPWIAILFSTIALAYIGAARPLELGIHPSKRPKHLSSNVGYLFGVIAPLFIAACALTLFWARAADDPTLFEYGRKLVFLVAAFIGMVLVPWGVYYGRIVFLSAGRRAGFSSTKEFGQYLFEKMIIELIAVVVALFTALALFYLLAKKVFPEPLLPTPDLAKLAPIARFGKPSTPMAQLYVCLAVPSAMLVFYVQASIFVGLSSKRNADADREWWGRGGGMLLMISVAIAFFCLVAVFGPVALYYSPALVASIGGLAGVAAAILGFSDKTPANQREKEGAKKGATIGNAVSGLLVPLFVVFILSLISLGSTWLIHEIGGRDSLDQDVWKRRAAMEAVYTETVRNDGESRTIETKEILPARPLASIPHLRTYAHLDTLQNTTSRQIIVFVVIAGIAVLLSRLIGVNKFSMHALYRNRLIRAYLGASRTRRSADAFTGFDENDNLQMWELRPELLWTGNIRDGFVEALRKAASEPGDGNLIAWVWRLLDSKTKRLLLRRIDDTAIESLVDDLNHIILTEDLEAKAKVAPPKTLVSDPATIGHGLPYRNRLLIDQAFGTRIVPMPPSGTERAPLHVINTALNVTTGQSLAWQQRQAESFVVTPFHSGSLYAGYRDSEQYGGKWGISLGTAVTISGAAASPNMGYHSSPAMAFLLTIFNVRLGSWLGHPGVHGQTSCGKAHPTSNLRPLFAELTGGSTDRSKWIYLSDGGHFENLGLYEMVLRRCHYIIASDAGADPKFTFEDLGNAIRKIRTDLGVPIDLLDKVNMQPRAEDGQFGEGSYVARAAIRYSVVDEGGKDGVLIYIKAGVYQNDDFLPRDVYNYAQESHAFPHEPTSDQFFSESQFESYRALGRHVFNEICANYVPDATFPPKPDDARMTVAKQFDTISELDELIRNRR